MASSNAASTPRDQWNASAAGWDRHFDWYALNFDPMIARMADLAVRDARDRILDLGTGSGQPALAVAARLSDEGEVIATDIAPSMLQVAERRARSLGLTRIVFREMSAESITLAEQSVNSVTFSCGLMFSPEPPRAVAEIRRVLKPSGRVVISVWDEVARNPFLAVFGQSMAAVTGAPPPPPDAPTPFRFASPGALERLLNSAGFADITIERCDFTCECATVADYAELCLDMSAGARARVATWEATDRARFDELVIDASRPYRVGTPVRLPATILIASAIA